MIEKRESITAELCSFARAYHSTYEQDKIYDDYLAFDFLGRDQYEAMKQLIAKDFNTESFESKTEIPAKDILTTLNLYITPIPLARIAFAETELQKFAAQYPQCQYVICGAGMDTYSFRNTNEKMHIFEVDHPDTQKYKLQRIAGLGWIIPHNVTFVPVDFTKDDMPSSLLSTGFNPALPTFYSVLGVTYYLKLCTFRKTIHQITLLNTGKTNVVFDFPDTMMMTGSMRGQILSKITAKLGEPMEEGYHVEELEKILLQNEFTITKLLSQEEIQEQYFAHCRKELSAFENIHFVLAEKEDAAK